MSSSNSLFSPNGLRQRSDVATVHGDGFSIKTGIAGAFLGAEQAAGGQGRSVGVDAARRGKRSRISHSD